MKFNLKSIDPIFVLAGLSILLIAYIIFQPKPNTFEGERAKYQKQIDSLNSLITDIQYKQIMSDSVITLYSDTVKKLNQDIREKKKVIIKIRKDYEEKIKDLSKLTPTQLSEFFTNRYKSSVHTVRSSSTSRR
jgi:hypothetical protein